MRNRINYFQAKIALAVITLIILNLAISLWNVPTASAAKVNPGQLLYIGNDRNLYVANADGTNRKALSSGIQPTSPRWSPDGSKIAFLQAAGPGTNTLYVVNADGTNQRKITDNVFFFRQEAWSPDSTRLAYTNAEGVWVINADGTNAKKLTLAKADYSEAYWSPNGTQLVFVKVATPNGPSGFRKDVITVNADGSNLTTAFQINGFLYGFWYDGQRIAYAEVPENATNPNNQIFTLALIKLSDKSKVVVPRTETPSAHEFYLSRGGDKVLIEILQTGRGARWAVAEVGNPNTFIKYLELPGASAIFRAAWGIDSNKVLAMVARNRVRLEEIDVPTLGITTVFENPSNVGVFPNFETDATGTVAFSDDTGGTFTIDPGNRRLIKLEDVGRGQEVRWKPSFFLNTAPEFYQVWQRSDAAVALNATKSRSWLWGPEEFGARVEDYKQAKGGKRTVQYFDKARMEINDPDGDRGQGFFVTNGLLPKELISGFMQTGDNEYEQRAAADISIAGDPNGSIFYSRLGKVVTLRPEIGQNVAPNRTGQPVTASIDRDGNVKEVATLPGVTLAQFVPQTQHNLPNVFVDYFKTLPQDWVFVMGYPISEPYQTEINLAGKPTTAIIQVFERRVLTYTPSNPDPFKVEQGNVGRHYFLWRYGSLS
jgi:hypothetical protein